MLKNMWKLCREMLVLFFGKGQEELAKDTAKAAVLYRIIQWGLFGATISIVTTVRVMYPELGLMMYVIPLWIANVGVIAGILFVRSRTDVDFTLMEAVRQIITKAFALSKVAGFFLEAMAFLILLGYSGADQFYIFFESRLSSVFMKCLVIAVSSFCNMFIWVSIIYVGAGGLIEFLKMLYA